MARRKSSKTGCLFAVIVFVLLPLVVYLVQKPKGPETLYDASVSDNHLVYFDVVRVSQINSSIQQYTSRTRRTVTTNIRSVSEYSCTTANGFTVRLVDDHKFGSKGFDSNNAAGMRIHGVKVGEGSNAYVRFKRMTPLD